MTKPKLNPLLVPVGEIIENTYSDIIAYQDKYEELNNALKAHKKTDPGSDRWAQARDDIKKALAQELQKTLPFVASIDGWVSFTRAKTRRPYIFKTYPQFTTIDGGKYTRKWNGDRSEFEPAQENTYVPGTGVIQTKKIFSSSIPEANAITVPEFVVAVRAAAKELSIPVAIRG